MEALEWIVIGLGIVFIIVSYIISEKLCVDKNEASSTENFEDVLSAQKVKLEVSMKETLDDVEGKLCKLSNEKIMAVNEYGETILEQIHKNHSEVVFLYSMLNEKEAELKKLLAEANRFKKEIKEEKIEDKIEENIEDNKEDNKEEKIEEKLEEKSEDIKNDELIRVECMEESEVEERNFLTEDEKVEYMNRRKRIIDLHEQGYSVLQISQQLDMGQGEVQLIVNFYSGGLS